MFHRLWSTKILCAQNFQDQLSCCFFSLRKNEDDAKEYSHIDAKCASCLAFVVRDGDFNALNTASLLKWATKWGDSPVLHSVTNCRFSIECIFYGVHGWLKTKINCKWYFLFICKHLGSIYLQFSLLISTFKFPQNIARLLT